MCLVGSDLLARGYLLVIGYAEHFSLVSSFVLIKPVANVFDAGQ
jgi:hypothetical protein